MTLQQKLPKREDLYLTSKLKIIDGNNVGIFAKIANVNKQRTKVTLQSSLTQFQVIGKKQVFKTREEKKKAKFKGSRFIIYQESKSVMGTKTILTSNELKNNKMFKYLNTIIIPQYIQKLRINY